MLAKTGVLLVNRSTMCERRPSGGANMAPTAEKIATNIVGETAAIKSWTDTGNVARSGTVANCWVIDAALAIIKAATPIIPAMNKGMNRLKKVLAVR
jgi:hypothetical protein